MADVPGDPSTSSVVGVGSTTAGSIETIGDHDWYKITLDYGESVTITVTGSSSLNPYLNVYDSTGTTILASNDDIGTGQNIDSRLTFTPTAAGTYYIDVGASHDQSSGTYDLFVEPRSLNVWTYSEIANELTNYFWGGDPHHFNVAPGGTLTVNISSLTSAEQNLALAALADWTDISGINFQQVASGGQIIFSDAEDPSGPIAQTSANWSNGITSSAKIQISKSWVTQYGTGLDSYSLQTYIHEIGHALGLGHAGDYNFQASYLSDALYANDAWSTTVMSYFSPHDNGYFNNQGFSADFDLTPMIADVLGIQQLYGLSTTTRLGDTTYGYNSTADNPVYNSALYPDAAYTIFDSGGIDTLDYSGSSANQLINLNPETFSNINGQTGNMMIAPGVVIENAIGGAGDDTIIANAANNVLSGGPGNNTLSYETATGGVTVDLGLASAQNTGGSGVDTVSNFQNLIGSAFGDDLIGGPSTVSISGGAGDDRIEAGTSNVAGGPYMTGGDGNDTFVLGAGPVRIDGGAGFNIVDGSNAPSGLLLTTNGQVPGEASSTYNVQELIGSSYADTLTATATGDVLIGGAGDDTLTSYGGAQLSGGAGNDTYMLWNSGDTVIENAGEGTDHVISRGSYTLGANLENLTLYEAASSDPYAGAAVPSGPVVENWSATGNDLANIIAGNQGNNIITGLGGSDTLSGGGGNDLFQDTTAGLAGDTITDFGPGDKIVISDAILAGFSAKLSGTMLNFAGGSLTLSNAPAGTIAFTPLQGGGIALEMRPAPTHHVVDDFNGDGISDVLWRSDSGFLTDWLGTSSGGLIQNQANAGTSAADTSWQVVGTGDFNGDGRSDILWRNGAGYLTEWLGTSSGGFASNEANAGTSVVDSSWQIVGIGDFNGDGRSDVLWRNSSGYVTEWLGNSAGGFVSNQANAGTGAADSSWQVAGTGDFNGDGRSDVLWRSSSGYVTEWLGQSNGGFASNEANAGSGLADNGWQVSGIGDFNGDGISDVLWRNSSGYLTEWLGSFSGGFVSNEANAGSGAADTSWQVVGIGDYNGDGISDVLWRNSAGYVTQWLGTANGSFTSNEPVAGTGVADSSWHVEDKLV